MSDVVFVRIPKNASTSLYTFLGDKNLIRNERFSMDTPKYLNIFEPSHRTLSEIVDDFGDEVLEMPILAVVRNPFDRLVSMFFFARKYDLGGIYGISTDDFDTFAEQFYAWSANPDFFHAISQKDFITHNDYVADVCRFESLEDDVCGFVDRHGLDIDKSTLQKLNSTEHAEYSDYYSKGSRSIVEKMWSDDIEHFNYSF